MIQFLKPPCGSRAFQLGPCLVARETSNPRNELCQAWLKEGGPLSCDFTEDRVDWPRLLAALHELAANQTQSFVMITAVQLQDHFEADAGRDLRLDGCFLGLFTLRLMAVLVSMKHHANFPAAAQDWLVQQGFRQLMALPLAMVLASPFAYSLFGVLAAYSRNAREACPRLQGPPAVGVGWSSPDWGALYCFRGSVPTAMKLLVDVSSAWCGVQEPGAPATPGDAMVRQVPDDQALEVLVPLYEALEADLRAGGPSTQLAGIAHEYFQQAAVACAEAEAAALLSLAWTGLIPKQLAVSKAQDTIQGLTFPQAVFSRWPVWELMAHLSHAPPRGLTKDLEVSSCLSFEPCKRTVAFYKQRRIELLAPGLRCPPPSEKLRLAYSEGVLLLRSNLSEDFVPDQRGITWIPELRVTDISRVVQRMSAEEVEATSSFIARYLPQRRVSALELPLRLEWEGVQITSQVHQYGELHLEPQPLSSASNPRPPGPSIYLLILESASRAGFEAYCPLTMAFLRRQRKGGAWRAKDLGLFHAFLGGTVANMLPALSGFSYDKVKDSDRRATWDCDVVLDGIPEDRLIWNVAKKHGYKTIFGASGCNGFLGTRYCRNRLQEFDRVAPSLEVDPNCHSQNEWRLIVQERNRSRGCVGEKRPHEHLLNYFLRFQEIHADVPIFAYLHLEAAHEAQEALQLLDKALLSHLEGLSRLPPEARPVV
ncbi:unnamed protein product, partial [Effrenium voratum]